MNFYPYFLNSIWWIILIINKLKNCLK